MRYIADAAAKLPLVGRRGKAMRWLIAALALAVTAATAQAQQALTPQEMTMRNNANIGKDASRKFEEKNDQPKANDKAYNSALKNLPDKQYDPWRGVR